MTAQTKSPASDVFTELAFGTAVELGASGDSSGPRADGCTFVDRDAGERYDELSDHADGSLDTVLARHTIEYTEDLVQGVREWARVLRDGGRLAVLLRAARNCDVDHPLQRVSPQTFTSLLHQVGEFDVVRSELQADGWLVVAERRARSFDLRKVLGMHGAALADAAQRDENTREEIYFQFGTVLLRLGDGPLAVNCFERLHELKPRDGECLFGLGMAYALCEDWVRATAWLERTIERDPSNNEAKRWLGLTRIEEQAARNTSGDFTPQSALR